MTQSHLAEMETGVSEPGSLPKSIQHRPYPSPLQEPSPRVCLTAQPQMSTDEASSIRIETDHEKESNKCDNIQAARTTVSSSVRPLWLMNNQLEDDCRGHSLNGDSRGPPSLQRKKRDAKELLPHGLHLWRESPAGSNHAGNSWDVAANARIR